MSVPDLEAIRRITNMPRDQIPPMLRLATYA